MQPSHVIFFEESRLDKMDHLFESLASLMATFVRSTMEISIAFNKFVFKNMILFFARSRGLTKWTISS